ncbi:MULTISPECIES: cellulose biosynthesis regulator diguanylate cyclase DgcQ [unclassified Pantoea]|uniref:cellulose biosynthesis regulator diguanylate cyclase DgcQ n=1 Tax=unclassified Pantoea TaxID=2630326 RepID=UPI001CD428E0|nr:MULTISPECIES: cellulose biosynthesis regulator diguanylate cyclase DgcQ [unclassified Pantoea]MCA1176359.1 cellulose biosynthesis regulator YedQ [Pantoea sp. alder69]MCA1249329.1 cellulose biosynthesis regulator YedQ [Pantoea sp. alder70]MCA1264596.1 cellulose biosynthesis regulator YedQ [Pantoea sp. alder81]
MPTSLLPQRAGNPFLPVHLCFLAVFLFSAFLTVHEAIELKNNYEERQRAQLAEIQKNLDSRFQESIDELTYYERMLNYALMHPLDSNQTREAITLFQQLRQQTTWQLKLASLRSMPLNGVSDSWLMRDPLLQRKSDHINSELRAAMEFSFIMQFSDPGQDFHSRFWYISRAGFFISSRPPQSPQELIESYTTMTERPYFRDQAPDNPQRGRLHWSEAYQGEFQEGLMMTVSTPIVSHGYWYGVLSMDFTQTRIHTLMTEARHSLLQGKLLMVDRSLNEITRLHAPDDETLTSEQQARLEAQIREQPAGVMRLGTQFASWSKLKNVDAYIVNIQSLKQGMSQELGSVSLFLLSMWLLFVLLLLVAHQVIIRLVRRMADLSAKLTWRANYDGMTRLLNRNAFFEQFVALAAHSQQQKKPIAVIQLDVDHFKNVNDTWGHAAGDQALMRVAGVISRTLRKYDVAGRIGGEEFCIVLPETTLADAQAVAERIRVRLAAKTILVNCNSTFNITLSAGVTGSEEQGDYHAESLQATADRRLYLAKTGGRNRVVAED